MSQRCFRSQIALFAVTLAVIFPLAVSAQVERDATRCDSKKTLRVLFVGNSFTYVQNVPRMVEAIAASLPGPCIASSMIAVGGATLEDHWDADSVARRISEGGWTHVVLNDQSSFGESWFVDGQPRVGGSAELLRFSKQFAEKIRSIHAKPVLYAHWSNDGAPAADQQALDLAFAAAARQTESLVSPVGRAIKRMRSTMPDLTPYYSDGHHLSSAGAYLSALVTYGALTGRSPLGAASRISGEAVELERGIVFQDSIVALVDLPEDVALRVQRLAASTLAESRNPQPAHSVARLTSQFPRVERGEIIADRSRLSGHWSGTSTFLPTASGAPVSVELFLSNSTALPDSAVVRLPGEKVRVRGPRVFSGRAHVTVTHDVVVFRAPVAPNDGTAEFRGTLRSGVLSGVAEVEITGPGMRVFHSIGHFTLQRVE